MSGGSQPGATRPDSSSPGSPPPGPGGSGASGPPSGPGGAGGPGPGGPGGPEGGAHAGSGGPGRPWWRSAPRIALVSCVVIAAVVAAVVLTRPGGSGGGEQGEVFLQAASTSGPDPFTESTARDAAPPEASRSPERSPTGTQATRSVRGSSPGLYGGTRDVASCDVEKQVRFLSDAPDRNRAFAEVQDIAPDRVPAYLRSLTPVQLRMDTRVTNHGFRDGGPTSYQAVLQAGTAVLVDDRGVPRARCACGNPLLPPVAQDTTPKVVGDPWPGYRASEVVVVAPAEKPVKEFVLYDAESEGWIARPAGDTTGKGDKETEEPSRDGSPKPDPSDSPDRSPGESPPSSEDPGGDPPSEQPPSEQQPPPEDPPSAPPPSEEPPPASEPGSQPASEQAPPPASDPASDPAPDAPPSPGPQSAPRAAV
ncbi:DUF6777 domain-containing protein [Streptomyces sp. NPDC005805]|uniref:DUF6777 domain-containing protein n=1 Tax=Streptomyces sp. NPDC005805 TaxID=3157068 RepID=UPI0033F75D5A